MNYDFFDDEPLSDRELFAMLRENFSDDESTWEVVREAQMAYDELSRRIIRLEIEEEEVDIYPYRQPDDLDAA